MEEEGKDIYKGGESFILKGIFYLLLALIPSLLSAAEFEDVLSDVVAEVKYEGVANSACTVADTDGDGSLDSVFVTTHKGFLYRWRVKRMGERFTLEQVFKVNVGARMNGECQVVDINGDGQVEVVCADERGWVHAYNVDGSRRWKKKVGNMVIWEPVCEDVDQDGVKDIVVGVYTGPASCVMLKEKNGEGEIVWRYSTSAGVIDAPKVADVNGDGKMEVVFAAGREKFLYCVDEKGNRLWRFDTGSGRYWNYFWGVEPGIGDVDQDGDAEIVWAADGRCWVIDGKEGDVLFSYYFGGGGEDHMHHSPLVADVNRDGRNEVLWVTCENKIYAMDLDGKMLPGFPIRDPFGGGNDMHSTPAYAQGVIFITTMEGYMYPIVWDKKNKRWQIIADEEDCYLQEPKPHKLNSMNASPIICDLDGDGVLELLVVYNGGLKIWKISPLKVQRFKLIRMRTESVFSPIED